MISAQHVKEINTFILRAGWGGAFIMTYASPKSESTASQNTGLNMNPNVILNTIKPISVFLLVIEFFFSYNATCSAKIPAANGI